MVLSGTIIVYQNICPIVRTNRVKLIHAQFNILKMQLNTSFYFLLKFFMPINLPNPPDNQARQQTHSWCR